MKSTLLSVFVAALMAVGTGCASNSGGSGATGAASGSGGTSSAGGSTSSGGSGATGGAAGSGGAQQSGGTRSGGSSATGAASSSGGTSSAGGSASTGASGGTGGAAGSGGAQQSGGARSGGSSATGAASGSGGTSGAGGSTSSGGSGATGGAAGSGGAQQSGGAQGGQGIRARTIETRGFTFDALESGPADGEPVLLLHGFPDISLMWTNLMTVLAEEGYHCLAPDQRGYSPGARPAEVDAYRYEELIADSFAFGSELGDRFHLIAHDWGANIAWLMLEADSSPIASFTPIAIPHYRVWARAALEDEDMASYRQMLNTWMTPGDGEDFWTPEAMRNMWKAKPADQREQTIAQMMEPGAMTAALNWYRASRGHKSVLEDFDDWEVNVPTLLIFGTGDMGQSTVTDTAPLMTGPYRVVQPGGGHFIVDEQPQVVAEETLAHLRAYPLGR